MTLRTAILFNVIAISGFFAINNKPNDAQGGIETIDLSTPIVALPYVHQEGEDVVRVDRVDFPETPPSQGLTFASHRSGNCSSSAGSAGSQGYVRRGLFGRRVYVSSGSSQGSYQ